MRDSPIEIERMMLQMLEKKSGLERLQMACSMFHTGKELLLAGIADRGYSESQKRGYFLKQMYGDCFSSDELHMIASKLPRCEIPHE